jgi:hypothetical protein
MRRVFRMGLLVALATSAFAQQTGRLGAGEQPPQPLRGVIHGFADPMPVRSFKDLCDRADAIIEGVVEADASRMMPGRDSRIETDFWIAVSRVLKGSVDTPKIVVFEMGGTFGELQLIMNLPLLQRGERYVLFLHADGGPASLRFPVYPDTGPRSFSERSKSTRGRLNPLSAILLKGNTLV